MKIARIITMFILFVVASACRDTGSSPNDDWLGPMDFKNPMIPLALGNRWMYVDSLFANAGLVVDTYTVSIQSSRIENRTTWWKFNRRFNPSIFAREFSATNDSVFSLQYAEAMPGLVPVQSLEYIWPLAAPTLRYRSTFDGDVGISKTITNSSEPFSISIGSFPSSLTITYDIGGQLHRETIVPHVGMADLQITNNSPFPMDQWWTRRRIQLLEYQVSQ